MPQVAKRSCLRTADVIMGDVRCAGAHVFQMMSFVCVGVGAIAGRSPCALREDDARIVFVRPGCGRTPHLLEGGALGYYFGW
jgi:hypothetical protein